MRLATLPTRPGDCEAALRRRTGFAAAAIAAGAMASVLIGLAGR